VKELVETQLKEGICKTEQDAYRRVEQASKQVEQKAEKMAAADPLRESCDHQLHPGFPFWPPNSPTLYTDSAIS
jgi:hypothetical protein